MRRTLMISAAVAIAALIAGAGWIAVSREHGAGAAPVLKVASQKGGTKSLMLAAGVLAGTPYRIEWSEFPSAQALLEALGAGAVDIGQVGDAPFMFGYASGLKIKAVQVAEQSRGESTAVIVPAGSGIHAVADLRGRRIATGKGSIGHYLLLRAIERAGLAPRDVDIVFMAPADAKAAFSSGAVDAWATWRPYVGLAVLHDGARVLVDGTGLMSGIGFEAANQDAIAGKPAQLADFLHRLTLAERWAGSHRAAYAAVMARETGLPPDVARYVVDHAVPRTVPIGPQVIAEERLTVAHFVAAGVMPQPADVAAAFETRFDPGS